MDITLNDVARDVLDGPHIAAIATSNADGRPQSSLIFVKRDGDTVVFSTIKGRLKTRNMARDPRVSLLVVDKGQNRYLEIRGRVEITDDPEKRLLYEMYDRYMDGIAPPPEPDADRLISSGGLKLAKTIYSSSPEWPKGTVIEQIPDLGAKVTSDTPIELVAAQ